MGVGQTHVIAAPVKQHRPDLLFKVENLSASLACSCSNCFRVLNRCPFALACTRVPSTGNIPSLTIPNFWSNRIMARVQSWNNATFSPAKLGNGVVTGWVLPHKLRTEDFVSQLLDAPGKKHSRHKLSKLHRHPGQILWTAAPRLRSARGTGTLFGSQQAITYTNSQGGHTTPEPRAGGGGHRDAIILPRTMMFKQWLPQAEEFAIRDPTGDTRAEYMEPRAVANGLAHFFASHKL